MKTNNLTKILSLILCVAVLLVSVGVTTGITSVASEENLAPAGEPAIKGDLIIPTSIKDYEAVSNYGAKAVLANNPNLSIVREGVDNTYALKIAGTDDATATKSGYIKLGSGTNTLLKDTEYTVSMKVKKVGTVNSFISGIDTAWTPQRGTEFKNADIKENEWTVWTFDVTPALNGDDVTGWCHVYLGWDIPKDSYLLIDDISVAAKTDSYNVLSYGSFDQNVYAEVGLNNDPIVGATYTQADPAAMNADGIKNKSDVGYKGSYGGQVVVNDAETKGIGSGVYGQLRFANVGTLETYTEYYIDFKVRKTGNITGFQMRVRERWQDHQAFMLTSPELVSTYLTEDWSHYIVKYKTNHDTVGAHSYVKFIAYGDTDAAVYVDEVRVYKVEDASKTNILSNGDFDTVRIAVDVNTEWKDFGAFEQAAVDDNYLEDVYYSPNGLISEKDGSYNISEFGGISNYGNRVLPKNENAAIQRVGADGSFALTLKGNGVKQEAFITVGTKVNVMKLEKTYVISMDVKVTGTITTLTQSITHNWVTTIHDIPATADWATYSYEITPLKDGAKDSGWNHIGIQWNAAADATIFIDNIKVIDKETGENLFPEGTFDNPKNVGPNGSYKIEEFDAISNFAANRHLPNNPNASVEKIGVDGSFGLRLKGNAAKQDGHITIGTKTNVFARGTTYVITMKAKKIGDITEFTSGITYEWKWYPTAFELTDEWETYSFEITPATVPEGTSATSWYHLGYEWTAPVGSEVLIDDISIFAKDTTNNLFPEGVFDNPADRGLSQNVVAAEGEGVRGSIAGKLVGTGKESESEYIFEYANVLENNTEYYIEFKVKRSGNINSFGVGLKEAETVHPVIEWKDTDANLRISDEVYYNYRVKYTTTDECDDGFASGVMFKFKAPVGSYVLLDDVRVYKVNDETQTDYLRYGSADYAYRDIDFDNKADSSVVYVPKTIERYTGMHRFSVTNASKLKAVLSIAEGEGVKGSAAMKLAGDGATQTFKYTMQNLSELVNYGTYKIGLKIKVVGGSAANLATSESFFQIGIAEDEGKNFHYVMSFKGDDFGSRLTDDYHYYQAEYTTDGNCWKVWSFLTISYQLPKDVAIYIDELELIPVSDNAKWVTDLEGNGLNIVNDGNFDSIDKGQSPVEFMTTEPENEKTVCSYYHNSANAEPKAVVGAKTGNHVLAFGFGEEAINGKEFIGYLQPSMPGESYKISFWVKIVGDATGSFSMSDGYWLNHSTGLNFDKYEEGEWVKYEFVYNDKTTGVGIATYRRFRISFSGPAGSGMLIDNVTAVRVNCGYEGFNILAGGKGDFEQSTIYPNIDWLKNDRFISKKEGK